jgi:hypothetical protein
MRSQNLNPTRHTCLLILAFALIASLSGAAPVTNLSLTIRCTITTLLVGDEIPITFCISNIANYEYSIRDQVNLDIAFTQPNFDRGRRMEEYRLTVIDERGNKILDPHENFLIEGEGVTTSFLSILKPGKSYKKFITLNDWALINAPGRYQVTGAYYPFGFMEEENRAITSPPITIVVKPCTEAEMEAYIHELAEEIRCHGSGGDDSSYAAMKPIRIRAGAIQKLMYTCHPNAVPIVLDCLYERYTTGLEIEALNLYLPHNETTRQMIVDMGEKRGYADGMKFILGGFYLRSRGCPPEEMYPVIKQLLAPENPERWLDGAHAAQNYPNDDFTPRLVEIATKSKGVTKRAAITALGLNRNLESVKALRLFLNDPDKNVQESARDAIRMGFKTNRGDAQGRPLKPEDFDELF